MACGTSVPSESAFSDSGGFVIPRRIRLSDESIETMMKLRSWNRFLGIVQAPNNDAREIIELN
jgi:hypothetical protein